MLGPLDCGLIPVGQLSVNLSGDCVTGRIGEIALDLSAQLEIFELINWRHDFLPGTRRPGRASLNTYRLGLVEESLT